jgi:hypothetical protein
VSAECCKTGFPIVLTRDCRNAMCDSCGGIIGGPRLFCLDCAIKVVGQHESLDLCCAPKCVAARVTHVKGVEVAHEPNHRLVKVRTTVLLRSHGRVHTAACDAFERVGEETCRTVAVAEQILYLNSLGCSKGGPLLGEKGVLEVIQTQVLGQRLPTCGNCKGRLSFPFWFCIYCKGKFLMKNCLFLNVLNASCCAR